MSGSVRKLHRSALWSGSRAGGLQAASLGAVAFLLLAPPAAAYDFAVGGFANGSDVAALDFDGATTELYGPALRLLTNSTVANGTLLVGGSPGFFNSSIEETSTADFASYKSAQQVEIAAGNLALASGGETRRLNGGNGFGNASFNGTRISGGVLVLDSASSGYCTSENLTAPTAGWGVLLALATLPAGSGLRVDILRPNGTVLVSNQSVGAVIDVDPILNPQVRVRATLTVSAGISPELHWIQFGQQAGDTLLGTGVVREESSLVSAPGGGLTLATSATKFVRHPSNPMLPVKSGTWYSGGLSHADLIQVGSEYWLYFIGTNSTSPWQIGRAVSTDLINWSVSTQPVLNVSAGEWDSTAVLWPRVIEDPLGSGYLMFYTGYNGTSGGRVGLATSTNGVSWAKHTANPILSTSASGWDSLSVGPVANVSYSGGTWTMWYSGTSNAASSTWTFFYESLGVATSTDGKNWTKYTSNPVLSKGASYDSGDLRAGDFVLVNGTIRFYYSCDVNLQKYQICLATSSDGYTWTKVGVVLATGSGGWDHELADLSVLMVNESIVMYYAGFGPNAQLGRAESAWEEGVLKGRVDFGSHEPLALVSANVDADNWNAATEVLQLRTSADGVAWSAFENLSAGGAVQTTLSNRFLEWSVYLRGTPGAAPPVLRAVTVDYVAYSSSGRYESSIFRSPEPVSGITMTVSRLDSSSGSVGLEVSTNNGSNWSGVVNGTFSLLPAISGSFSYALRLEGTTSRTPLIDSVTLRYERKGYPADVSARVGINGTPFFVYNGVLDRATNVSLPSDQLNSAIQAALLQNPSAVSVDVPLIVTSSHFGRVELREPRLTIVLKNPLMATFSPASASVSVNENSTAVFSTSAISFPAWVPVNVSWFLDGREVGAAHGSPTFTYAPDFLAAGNHTLRCFVENGDFFVNRSWAISVQNVNRGPLIPDTSPASPLSISHTASRIFSVSVFDPDGDEITYRWSVDGVPQNDPAAEFISSPLSVGTHTITVTASDFGAAIGSSWEIYSTNAAPGILYQSPLDVVLVSTIDTITLQVAADDADGDNLTYFWTRDGIPLGYGASSLQAGSLQRGSHIFMVLVSDGLQTDSANFDVDCVNFAPRITAAFPESDIRLTHVQNLSVRVEVSDYESDPVRYAWRLGPTLLTSNTNTTTVEPLAAGNYTLTLEVKDAFSTVTRTWNVTVIDRPPEVSGLTPAPGEIRTAPVTQVVFSARVADPEGDAIDVRWYADNALLNGTTEVRLQWAQPGTHDIALEIRSGGFRQTIAWKVVVVLTNQPPLLTHFEPNTSQVHVRIGVGKAFVVSIEDDGVLPVSIIWKLDGVVVANGSGFFYQPVKGDAGEHTIVAEITDGEFNASQAWNLEVSEDASVSTAGPSGDLFIPIAIVVAAVILVVTQLYFRRRPQE